MRGKKSSDKLSSIIAASTVGTLIEWYDFFIFGSLATIISTVYFPAHHPTASFLATLATFSAGLIVRPLGALIFGRLGDLTGRKFTFMITLSIMGISTVGMGLVPGYDSIGIFAPIIVLILRLLQGLALGGEYGGAVTYVAEHGPAHRKGLLTSWLQSTSGVAFVLSIVVVLLIKSLMPETAWYSWGWRIPFIASALLVIVSIYIRNRMSESPLFTEAKSAGQISKTPICDSFGKKENLKIVLVAFLGLTLGGGAIGWITFYALGFMLKTMMLDFDQANQIIITGILAGVPFFFLFGWLSDKIGRKGLLMLGMLMGALLFRPIFKGMYQIGVTNSSEWKMEEVSAPEIVESYEDGVPSKSTVTYYHYENGAVKKETKTETIRDDRPFVDVSYSLHVSKADKWRLVFLVFSLQFIFTLAYGPLGAYMVELFPVRIRYTSVSFPYHFGVGIFGGLAPYFSAYLVSKAQVAGMNDFYLAGLRYPEWLTTISFVIGMIYLKDAGRKIMKTKTYLTGLLNFFRRWLGLLWIVLALYVFWFGIVQTGLPRIFSGQTEDLVFGIIVSVIITPVLVTGLFVFGIYSLKNEYAR